MRRGRAGASPASAPAGAGGPLQGHQAPRLQQDDGQHQQGQEEQGRPESLVEGIPGPGPVPPLARRRRVPPAEDVGRQQNDDAVAETAGGDLPGQPQDQQGRGHQGHHRPRAEGPPRGRDRGESGDRPVDPLEVEGRDESVGRGQEGRRRRDDPLKAGLVRGTRLAQTPQGGYRAAQKEEEDGGAHVGADGRRPRDGVGHPWRHELRGTAGQPRGTGPASEELGQNRQVQAGNGEKLLQEAVEPGREQSHRGGPEQAGAARAAMVTTPSPARTAGLDVGHRYVPGPARPSSW